MVAFLYIIYLQRKVRKLSVENKEFEEFVSLKTTVESLIEVIRQEEDIYISANIMATTLTTLLKAEGMGIYKIKDGVIESAWAEYFKELENQFKYRNFLSSDFIKEVTSSNQDKAISIRKIPTDDFIINLISIWVENVKKLPILIVIFERDLGGKEQLEVNNFTSQVLYYCTHLVSLMLDIRQKAEIDKIIAEKERSEKQAAELAEKLEQEIKNSELQNEFIGIISHEFRTPLAVIASSIKLLEMNINHIYTQLGRFTDKIGNAIAAQDAKYFEEERKHLQESLRITQIKEQTKNIHNYILKLTTLIESTLRLSVIESALNMQYQNSLNEKTDLKYNVEEIITHFKNIREDITINFSFDTNSHVIYFDSKSLYLVLSNILSNAIKFSKPKGKVKLDLYLQQNYSILIIEDQGIGIPKENLNKVFSKFYRAHNVKTISGTGIGLYLANKLMECNGGNVSMESELDKGTKIKLTFLRVIENEIISEG